MELIRRYLRHYRAELTRLWNQRHDLYVSQSWLDAHVKPKPKRSERLTTRLAKLVRG